MLETVLCRSSFDRSLNRTLAVEMTLLGSSCLSFAPSLTLAHVRRSGVASCKLLTGSFEQDLTLFQSEGSGVPARLGAIVPELKHGLFNPRRCLPPQLVT